jgi:hypothetical protein
LIVAAVLFVGFLIFSHIADWNFDYVWRFETAGLLGAAVGTAELLSRYRDAPSFVVLSPPGIGYVAINAVAALAAMGIILAFNWKFGATGNAAAATQVLVAGFGSMALFRSSLLTVKAGNDDVGIGPSSVLSIMMAAADRSADRLRAADRAGRVRELMKDVSYARASDSLPTVTFALMQNLSPADVAALKRDLDGLKREKPLPDSTKAILLGLKLTDLVSTGVLKAAIDTLAGSCLIDGSSTPVEPRENGQPEPHKTAEALTEALPTRGVSSASEGLPQTPQTPDPPK